MSAIWVIIIWVQFIALFFSSFQLSDSLFLPLEPNFELVLKPGPDQGDPPNQNHRNHWSDDGSHRGHWSHKNHRIDESWTFSLDLKHSLSENETGNASHKDLRSHNENSIQNRVSNLWRISNSLDTLDESIIKKNCKFKATACQIKPFSGYTWTTACGRLINACVLLDFKLVFFSKRWSS